MADDKKGPSQPSVPTKKPDPANSDNPESTAKATSQKKGDATLRVSEKPSDAQAGPNAKDVQSKKKSTDTRGSKESAGKNPPREEVTGKPAEEQVPTAAETAAKQPIRKDDSVPAPVEEVKVKGQPVEVFAPAVKVDPTELKPSKRDTLEKDRLRSEGLAHVADAPTREPQGGNWVDADVNLAKGTAKPPKED